MYGQTHLMPWLRENYEGTDGHTWRSVETFRAAREGDLERLADLVDQGATLTTAEFAAAAAAATWIS